jgi:hypothetical protein
MPPLNERQSLEQELAELLSQIAVHLRELTEIPEAPRTGPTVSGWPGRCGTWRSGWQTCGRGWRPSRPRASRMTRAQQTGLRLEDIPRPSLAKRRRRHKLDAQVRQALGLVLQRRRRPKKAGR